MQITLMDLPEDRVNLLPLTYLKSIADLRIGILTIRDKWKHWMGTDPTVLTSTYLQSKYQRPEGPGLLVNSTVMPTAQLVAAIGNLSPGQQLKQDDLFIAGYVNDPSEADQLGSGKTLIYDHPIRQVCFSWDVFRLNPGEIEADFALLATNKKSQAIDDPHTCQYGDKIFLEEGVHIKAAVLNAEDGPIYFGKNVKISEGSIVRGPTALCEGSQLSMGAKVRGNVTVGPYSKIGGEVSNAVLQGYSNKSHDGYLGSSVVGEWCNLGAATNNSNLKNNYGKVKMWNFANRQFRDSGLQFCGLIMGDHTRCAINTTFNTGTTTGIMSNIFGAGFHRNFIPSFSWGGTGGFATYQFEKAVESAERAMIRREQRFSEEERGILRHIFETTATDRTWELK